MKLAGYTLKLEKKASFSGLEAILISVVAIAFALFLVGFIFLQAGVNPAEGYKAIFTYAFANSFGVPLTINRAVFILLSSFAFIVPIRAGLWNIGMAGQLYFGALSAFGVAYALGARVSGAVLSPWVVIPLMIIGAIVGGGLIGAIPGVLKGRFNTNEIVVTMMLNFIGYWVVAHMIKEGGPFMGSGGEGEGYKLPASIQAPVVSGVSILTLVIALVLAILLYVLFTRTRFGYQIRAFGHSPAASRYAGISPFKIAFLTFVIGGALAGLAGYHYFGTVPNLNQIPKNYGDFGDMAFYGIICGLISQGNPLAAIPLALLFGGLTSGGRYVQGKLHLSYGIDYALLGVLMIVLVAFQFFFRYRFVLKKES
ncbi:MAG: ABC transporter permease [Anaerolineaceae bacterium]|nr:ABC transporter permease [Anaerolineaceae bacterium]